MTSLPFEDRGLPITCNGSLRLSNRAGWLESCADDDVLSVGDAADNAASIVGARAYFDISPAVAASSTAAVALDHAFRSRAALGAAKSSGPDAAAMSGSLCSEPNISVALNPEPTSNPLVAGMDMIALARSASSLSKTGDPSPAGTRRATHSTTP
eukprot:CAMPEP_0185266398 /NCGR_PEP_ID=MMETSP1359-20130426/30942_1 /TAXON_ID=552665 /ORGANISM="Bigelowiella longifila, Strain CCMP242" /LENGTH=154 /DNA_ID=CAMNT_0027856191 /DNA_START=488 /DNA_END=949 /DNA_ORIENTATION=-